MKVVRPLPISLTASSVPETDYPAWDAGTTYALGARVIVVALHRVFESVSGGNVGHAPTAGGSSFWLDVGPTNRWAMFDQAAGPATRANASLVVTIALSDDADTIGLVDLQAASVRVEIASAGVTLLDTTRGAPAACEVFLGLPAGTARSATITIEPTGGAAVVGKLITGAALDLGTLADAPTVGLTDFSRRETDAFGVTTIAERGWTKRIEAKCRIDEAAVDGIQRQLAAIRAQASLWIGEGNFPSLIAYGIFKDFSQVISLQGVSTCSLSIEGYPAADIATTASDPALNGASDFQVVRPAAVTDAVLVSSSVPEHDFPVYAASTAYVAGARVILPATHRAYESLTAGNLGHDPASSPANWVDIGPTNRWALFDQALGSATTATGSIVVQLKPGTFADTIAVLDVDAATVRVQAPGYDKTRALGGNVTSALFLDLVLAAGDTATVTIAGANSGAAAAVGTLLIGAREGLGTLADEPTIGMLDFSVKDTDDFGNTVPLERAWAKRMEAKSQIATAGADALLRRLATLRAQPSLWIGAAELDALTIYGFFRDFTVSLGERVSTCSVTIEGMAKAAPELPSQTIALTAYLTNEDHTVPADAAGNVTSYSGAGGNFIIRDGADEVQASFNFTVVENPQSLAVTFDGAGYAVTGGLDAAEDAATITIKAVGFGPYSGITAAKQFSLSKSKAGGAGGAGAPGAAAKLLSILSNRQTISYDGAGAPAPADQTITFKVNKQNTTATVYWSITDAAGTPVSLIYLSAPTGDTVYITENNFRLARGSTPGVIVTGTLTDGTTLSDSISVVAVKSGAPGAPGKDGIGEPGKDGVTLYSWYAYADSADGAVNFTTDAPGRRGYQGIATNKTTATESTNPADYQWGPYKGPASFGLVPHNDVIVGPDYIVKVGNTGQWDGSAYSSEAFIGGAFASVVLTESSRATVFGLNTDPTVNASWETIDHALYVENSADRKLFYMESGALVFLGNWNVGDKLQITYDNKTARYLQNGNEIRSVGAVPNLRLYFDSSIAEQGKRISDIKFGPAGSVGVDAINNVNRVRNSMFERGLAGWQVPFVEGGIVTTGGYPTTFTANGVPILKYVGTAPAAGRSFSLGTAGGFYIPVAPNERIAVQVAVESGNTSGIQAVVYWVNASGAEIGGPHFADGGGSLSFGTVLAGFLTVPAGAVSCRIEVYFTAAGPGEFFGVIMKPMISSATATQTELPPFTPGSADGAPGAQGNPGGPGSPGAPALYLKVTRKAVGVDAYANGGVKSYDNANGFLSVWLGTQDVTGGAILSVVANGCTGTINTDYGNPVPGQPKGFYRVTSMSGDTATLDLYASYNGQQVSETFSLVKQKGGYEPWPADQELPTTNLFESRIIYWFRDKKIYRYDGSGWNRSADGADLAPNSITTNQIAAGAIQAYQMAVTQLDAITGRIGLLRTSTVGARSELSDTGLRIHAGNNALAIKLAVP